MPRKNQKLLEVYAEGVDWNTFYIKRDKPAPFLRYNKLPDKCVVDFIREHKRLKEFWGEKLDVADIRKGENIVDNQMWESEYLYVCVLKKGS